jgi:acetyl-CoA carboxylase carboxyltransferase component
MPVLVVGEAGGARLPDTLRGDVFASEPIYPWLFDAARPPLVAAIVGESYGGSSFIAAMADISVMTKGSVLALTSPRVVGMATGEQQLDDVLRRALGFFTHPRLDRAPRPEVDVRALVPTEPAKVYDVHGVVDAVVDVDSFLELGAERGKSVVTGLGRVDGRVVGIVASQPRHEAGALSPVACEKAARLTRLCDRFGFPIVSLVDTPGFQIGVHVEHSGMLRHAMGLIATNTNARVPVVTVILRKAFGLAFFAMFSPDHGGDVVVAWPDARIGFMDPVTAANVLYGDELADVPTAQRRAELAEKAEALGASSSARDVAAALGIDEIIHERETVDTIRRALDVLSP